MATQGHETELINVQDLKATLQKFKKDKIDAHTQNQNNPHNVTKAQLGLGNVGNFKAVSTAANQGLTDTEKSNAKANIGLNNVDNTSDASKDVLSAKTLTPIADIEDYGAGMSVDELKHLIFYNDDFFSGFPNGSHVVVFDDFIYNFEDDSYTVQGGSGEPAIITFIGGDAVMYPLWLVTISATNDDNIGVIERRDEGLILRWLAHTDDIPNVPAWALQSSKPTYTASEVGLGNVGNFKAVSTESNQGLSSTEKSNARTNIGLGNVENKSSSDIRGELTSSNVTSALGYTPINQNEKGANSGVATLGADGKVPSTQLPSYVDDVLEYATLSDFPAAGESGKIYVDLSTDRTYRWSGTQYTPIKGDLAIGSTTGTAADGGVVNTHITDSTIHVTSAEKQTWNNKQKAIAEGRGITVTTGADADTVSLNLPIYAGSGNNSIAEGRGTEASGTTSHAEGSYTTASGTTSHAEGFRTTAGGFCSHAEGSGTITYNQSEHASGQYNVSNQASETFGDSGNTLFSVGNGTSNSARHNAFEIRQNGDIYLTLGGQDVKLQDTLGNKVDKTTTVNGHALSGNVAVTKSDVGLGNVGNFKAVSTEANQGLTDTEKSNARTNLGLGSMATKDSLAESDIPSIHKSKISDFPTSLPANGGDSTTVNGHTVLSDVPANAVFTDTNTWRPLGTGATDACAGNDSRLGDARVASNMIANYTEVSSNTSGVTTSLTQDGSETKVYYNSGNAAVTVSFATSGLVFTDGNDSMEIPAGGYGEVNFLRVTTGNTTRVFVRSIVSE